MVFHILLSAACMGILAHAAFMHPGTAGAALAGVGAASAALILGAGGPPSPGIRDVAVPPALMAGGVLLALAVEPWLAIPSVVLSGYAWALAIHARRSARRAGTIPA